MAIRNLHQKLMRLGVFLLPVIAVKGMGAILGAPGPADVAAATLDPVITEVVHSTPPAPDWSREQLDAAARIDVLRQESFGASPLFYEQRPVQVDPTPIIDPTPVRLNARLQAIFATPVSVTALINGRPYRAGETIAGTAWRVESIDSEGRVATVVHEPSGTTRTLTVDRRN